MSTFLLTRPLPSPDGCFFQALLAFVEARSISSQRPKNVLARPGTRENVRDASVAFLACRVHADAFSASTALQVR